MLPLSLVAPAALSACGGDDDDDDGGGQAGTGVQGETPPIVEEESVVYQGSITDEALRSMLGVPPQVDETHAAALVSPAAGATMSAAMPPTFTWSAPQAMAPAQARPSMWARARAAIAEPQALAHGTPYSGAAYLLSIVSSSGTPLMTAITPETSFTPTAATWEPVANAGGDVRVYLLTARYEQNAVVGGGPFTRAAGPMTMTVGP